MESGNADLDTEMKLSMSLDDIRDYKVSEKKFKVKDKKQDDIKKLTLRKQNSRNRRQKQQQGMHHQQRIVHDSQSRRKFRRKIDEDWDQDLVYFTSKYKDDDSLQMNSTSARSKRKERMKAAEKKRSEARMKKIEDKRKLQVSYMSL